MVTKDGRWKLRLHMEQLFDMTVDRRRFIVAVYQYLSFKIQVLVLLHHAYVEGV